MRGFFMGGYWLWLLAVGFWLLAFGCWLLAVGCWLLAVGCWLGKELFLAQKQNPICFRKWGFGI
jgi:hypothetical protein